MVAATAMTLTGSLCQDLSRPILLSNTGIAPLKTQEEKGQKNRYSSHLRGLIHEYHINDNNNNEFTRVNHRNHISILENHQIEEDKDG